MKLLGRQFIKINVLLIWIALLTACPGKRSETGKSGTGQDSFGAHGSVAYGGGAAQKSTADEVNRMIDLAISVATKPDKATNIFMQFWFYQGFKSKTAALAKPDHLFPNYKTKKDPADAIPMLANPDLSSSMLQAFSKNKIVRLASGDCPHAPDETTADASVSEHSLNATICFSIGNLTAVAKSDLGRQVFSLVIHEASHMGTANETEARAWQDEFAEYFGERFGDMSLRTLVTETVNMIVGMQTELGIARGSANNRSWNSSNIYARLGQLENVVENLPNGDDALALQIKLGLLDSKVTQEYVREAQLIQYKTTEEFVNPDGWGTPNDDYPDFKALPVPTDKATMLTAIDDLNNEWLKLNKLFLSIIQASVGNGKGCQIQGIITGAIDPNAFSSDWLDKCMPIY